MKALIDFQRSSRFEFVSLAEEGDLVEKFSGGRVFFRMFDGWVPGNAHPDLLALVVIVVLHPFIKDRLSINIAVSEEFKAACSKHLPYACDFLAAERIQPRVTGRCPGLSFSGGVDSTAALAVMPGNTKLFFLDRVTPEGGAPIGLYVKESAEVACQMVSGLGYEVHRVETNLEYIRNPIGFPIDWASGAPAILMADHCDLSSVSWGVVAESGYRVGHENFINFPQRTIYSRWDAMLRAVGLCLGAPVAGLSEVCTSLIVQKSPFAGVAQSCIRGSKNKPCMNCFKCFRKSMLDAALAGNEYAVAVFDQVIRFRGGKKIVLELPIKHENVFRWVVDNLKMAGTSPSWVMFRQRLAVGKRDMSWACGWYAPSAHLIPAEYRDHAITKIRDYVHDQSESEQRAFEAWDMRPDLASTEMSLAVAKLEAALT